MYRCIYLYNRVGRTHLRRCHTRVNTVFCIHMGVSLYKILFYFKALLFKSIILLPPPPVQRLPYCNTIARPFHNICPLTDPTLVMPYTINYW